MQTIDLLSTLVLVAAVSLISLRLTILAKKILFGSDITITNKKTKQSVKLGKHPEESQVRRLIEVIG